MEYFNSLKTGDLIGVANVSSGLFSKLIRYVTRSKYSHVCIFLKEHPFKSMGYCIFEADVITNRVRIIKLSEWLKTYKHAEFWVRHLHIKRDYDFYLRTFDLYLETVGKEYRLEADAFILAEYGSNMAYEQPEHNRFFCSGLATYFYQKIGMLNKDIDCHKITPSELFEKINIPALSDPELVLKK